MKKSSIVLPVLVLGGLVAYYFYKKKSATAATASTSNVPGLMPTLISPAAVASTSLSPINTNITPVASANLTPVSAPAAPNPFLGSNNFLTSLGL